MTNEKEFSNASYKKTDGSHQHNVKQKKLDPKQFILHGSIYISSSQAKLIYSEGSQNSDYLLREK